MAPLARLLLVSVTVLDSLINVASSVSAFSTSNSAFPATKAAGGSKNSLATTTTATPKRSATSRILSNHNNNYYKMGDDTTATGLHQRGGAATSSESSSALQAEASSSSASAAAPKKRIRIEAFDSMRFFLIGCIVLGHFIKFADPNDFVFKLFSQHNVIVGAFFALSGYVTAYTSTEIGQRAASPKLTQTPSQQWTLSRVFGWYPLHLLVLVIFSPMFVYADQHYNGWIQTIWHGFLSVTLTQAWFPMHSEVWNAPTWYLSGLAFATALMPFALPKLAQMDKKALRKTAVWLTIANVLPKLGYMYDFNTLGMPEGWTSPKAHPNLALFNIIRFNPALISAEVLLGAVACRLVMLDNSEKDEKPIRTNAFSTLGPLVAIVASMLFRATDALPLTDMLVRPLFFLPLFLRFLMACHRNTVKGSDTVVDPTLSILSNPILVWLGNLSFPIYIVHGPLGQVFYKKLVAQKLFGKVLMGPGYFGLYLASVLGLAWILQLTFSQNKAVAEWSKNTVNKLSSWM
ncbi:hypothetical protein ACA910_000503 [Epithemia clementina (nom. ined.)]